LNNLTPADVYFGRGEAILKERDRIKKLTLLEQRKAYQRSILSQSFKNQRKINSFEST
jgi:putative transposase